MWVARFLDPLALREPPAGGLWRLLTAATKGGRGRVVGFVTLA
jgi:hypothetical protein